MNSIRISLHGALCGEQHLFRPEKGEAGEPHSCQRSRETGRRLMNAREKPRTSQRKETFLSARFKWKLSQVKHKVNQIHLILPSLGPRYSLSSSEPISAFSGATLEKNTGNIENKQLIYRPKYNLNNIIKYKTFYFFIFN